MEGVEGKGVERGSLRGRKSGGETEMEEEEEVDGKRVIKGWRGWKIETGGGKELEGERWTEGKWEERERQQITEGKKEKEREMEGRK